MDLAPLYMDLAPGAPNLCIHVRGLARSAKYQSEMMKHAITWQISIFKTDTGTDCPSSPKILVIPIFLAIKPHLMTNPII